METIDILIHAIIEGKPGIVFVKDHNSGSTKVRLRFLANGLLETVTTYENKVGVFKYRTTKEQPMVGFRCRKVRYLKKYLLRKFKEGFVEYKPHLFRSKF